MLRYIARRMLMVVPTMLGISVVVFLLMRLVPGDVVDLLITNEQRPEVAETMRRSMGLDRPILIQYFDWLSHVLVGDLGRSLITGREILPDILQRIPPTIELLMFAMVISIGLSLPLGIVAAKFHNQWPDDTIGVFSMLGLSVPNFVIGTLLIFLFAIRLDWLPSGGYVAPSEDLAGNIQSLLMPSVALGLALTASTTRMTRSAMLEVMRQDYIQAARSKGLSGSAVLWRHALKNALIPIVTVIGVQTIRVLGGVVVIERVFGLPGLGGLTLNAVLSRDYPLIQAVVLTNALIVMMVNLLVDLTYSYLNPTIRYG